MDVSFTLDNINEAAKQLLKAIGEKKVIALHGEMGAGKTTLVHAVCDLMGVEDAVGSPTFSIINEYNAADGRTIRHLDLYRLKDAAEAAAAGVEDSLYSGDLCFVEWPEIAPTIFPPETVHCYLKIIGNKERMLQINL